MRTLALACALASAALVAADDVAFAPSPSTPSSSSSDADAAPAAFVARPACKVTESPRIEDDDIARARLWGDAPTNDALRALIEKNEWPDVYVDVPPDAGEKEKRGGDAAAAAAGASPIAADDDEGATISLGGASPLAESASRSDDDDDDDDDEAPYVTAGRRALTSPSMFAITSPLLTPELADPLRDWVFKAAAAHDGYGDLEGKGCVGFLARCEERFDMAIRFTPEVTAAVNAVVAKLGPIWAAELGDDAELVELSALMVSDTTRRGKRSLSAPFVRYPPRDMPRHPSNRSPSTR